MYLLVYKFGGSSVADAAGLRCAAGQLAEAAAAGFHIIAVVSAQGKTTDRLLQSTAELTAHPACREADQLLATGEQASAALMAMTLQERGLSAVKTKKNETATAPSRFFLKRRRKTERLAGA